MEEKAFEEEETAVDQRMLTAFKISGSSRWTALERETTKFLS